MMWSHSQAGELHATATEAKTDSSEFQAGIQYDVISPAWETNADDQVIVYEFFGYLCPHCSSFQPYMKKFEDSKADYVKVQRIPVVFQPMWKPYAQAYYTAEAMGIIEQTHEAMFKAIHVHRKQFRTIEEIAQWFADSFQVDKEAFLSTANSFMIDGLVRKSDTMMRAMAITSTPTVVVNGKFKPNAKKVRTRDGLMDVTNFLVAKEAKEMGLAE